MHGTQIKKKIRIKKLPNNYIKIFKQYMKKQNNHKKLNFCLFYIKTIIMIIIKLKINKNKVFSKKVRETVKYQMKIKNQLFYKEIHNFKMKCSVLFKV